MEDKLLSDANIFPSDEIIFSHIGKSKVYWELLFNHIHLNHPDFESDWRYYKDGKSWLLKTKRKSKTIFWLSIIKDSFRVSFYFGDKAEEAIMASSVSDKIKEEFKHSKRYGKIRGITLKIENAEVIEDVKTLILIRLKH
jgi:hypothetical protein